MALKDKIKWNKKFTQKSALLKPREVSLHVKKYIKQCAGTKALDLACGAGRHALFLAENGFNVEALDISEVVVESLLKEKEKRQLNALHVKIFDLDDFEVKQNTYDFIVMSNYLDRSLIYKASLSLHVKGIFVIETYMEDDCNEKSNSNSNNLLQAGELKDFFDDSFDILHYDEFENENYELYRMKKQLIVVQKTVGK